MSALCEIAYDLLPRGLTSLTDRGGCFKARYGPLALRRKVAAHWWLDKILQLREANCGPRRSCTTERKDNQHMLSALLIFLRYLKIFQATA